MGWKSLQGDDDLIWGTLSRDWVSLTHNLPNGDWLKEGGWFTAPCNVDPNNPEEDPGSSWKILDSEATPFHGFFVSRDPFLSWGEESHVDLAFCTAFLTVPSKPITTRTQ